MVQEAWQAVLSHITEPISINDNFFSVNFWDLHAAGSDLHVS